MSYAAAIDQLSAMAPELHTQPGQQRRKFSLAEIGALLTALGNPHHRFPSVLIAGTNGKGSTAATLASILQASGLRVGLYTSPHLVRPNERIRLNGAEISDDAFASLYFQVDDASRHLVLEERLAQLPSFFETLTAMAFLYFAEASVDIAVLEVGMGGRLDATNIVDPLLSIVTDISLDHTEWLGPTIAAIAREKAGILRRPRHPHHPAPAPRSQPGPRRNRHRSSAPAPSAPSPTCRPCLSQLQGRHIRLPSCRTAAPIQSRSSALSFKLTRPSTAPTSIATSPSPSPLPSNSPPTTTCPSLPSPSTHGIRATQWPGRLEVITLPVHHSKGSAPPQVAQWILDVAHNPAGAWALRAALRSEFGLGEDAAQPATLLFSCLRDKPLAEMAQILFPLFDEIIFAPIHSPRATPMADLLAAAESVGVPARAAASIAEALSWADSAPVCTTESARAASTIAEALTWAESSPIALGREAPPARPARTEGGLALRVAVAGSVYLVGEVRPLLLARAAKLRGSEIAQ